MTVRAALIGLALHAAVVSIVVGIAVFGPVALHPWSEAVLRWMHWPVWSIETSHSFQDVFTPVAKVAEPLGYDWAVFIGRIALSIAVGSPPYFLLGAGIGIWMSREARRCAG